MLGGRLKKKKKNIKERIKTSIIKINLRKSNQKGEEWLISIKISEK